MIGGDSFSEDYGDSEYAIETELDLEAFEDIVCSISKTTGKRKINLSSVVMMMGLRMMVTIMIGY